MVTLLVGMSIMAILMTATVPAWNQAARREKEAELVFRGQQYARAIGLFQRKAGPGVLPPNVNVLVDQKFLRKKYTDPITGLDFDLLAAAPPGPGATSPGGAGSQPSRGTAGSAVPSGGQGALLSVVPQPDRAGAVPGGIMGVASKSKAESLRVYNGRTHYNEWQFLYIAQTQAPGQAGPGGRGTGRGTNQPPPGFGLDGPGGRGRGQPPQGRGGGFLPSAGGPPIPSQSGRGMPR
jgi:type II secretory pathway pseudopilin PulG